MKHLDNFIDLLKEDGPVTSSAILRKLEAEGVLPAAARKRLQRFGPEVRRLRNFGLPKNQQLFYLQQDWLSPRFKDALIRAWQESNSVHANTLAVLSDDGTPSPQGLVHMRSGVPIRLKRQVGFERLLSQLGQLELVQTYDVPELGRCVSLALLSSGPPSPPQYIRASLLAERIVIGSLREWLRKLGLISYEAGTVRGDEPSPEFAQFPFDLVSPSYARPLATDETKALQPGFMVADVWLGTTLSFGQVAGFIRKTSLIRAMPRSRPFMAFLVADRFSEDSWKLGKQKGLLFTTPEILFGREAQQALNNLVHALATAAETATTNPGIVADLFDQLGRIEGAAGNLRGPLFELIVAYVMGQLETGLLDIGRIVTAPDGQRAEIDVFHRGRTLIRVCECRGHGPGHIVTEEKVRQWIDTRVPRIRQWLLAQAEYREIPYSFEYSGSCPARMLTRRCGRAPLRRAGFGSAAPAS